MPIYEDIDLYSRDNPDGSAISYYAEDAIKNALNQWVNSKKGDYLMNPTAGGPIDSFIFKTMTDSNIFSIRFQLLSALTNEFSPAITVNDIIITPDYENRMTEIEIIYSIPSEGSSDRLSVFVNSNYSVNAFEYEDVAYIEQNLLEFVTIKKPDLSSNRLLYDHELNSWKWGKFKFINLLPTDPYFSDILLICNGS
jgi:hypothetical protein